MEPDKVPPPAEQSKILAELEAEHRLYFEIADQLKQEQKSPHVVDDGRLMAMARRWNEEGRPLERAKGFKAAWRIGILHSLPVARRYLERKGIHPHRLESAAFVWMELEREAAAIPEPKAPPAVEEKEETKGAKGSKKPKSPTGGTIKVDLIQARLYVGSDDVMPRLRNSAKDMVLILAAHRAQGTETPMPLGKQVTDGGATYGSARDMLRRQIGAGLANRIVFIEREKGVRLMEGVEIIGGLPDRTADVEQIAAAALVRDRRAKRQRLKLRKPD